MTVRNPHRATDVAIASASRGALDQDHRTALDVMDEEDSDRVVRLRTGKRLKTYLFFFPSYRVP